MIRRAFATLSCFFFLVAAAQAQSVTITGGEDQFIRPGVPYAPIEVTVGGLGGSETNVFFEFIDASGSTIAGKSIGTTGGVAVLTPSDLANPLTPQDFGVRMRVQSEAFGPTVNDEFIFKINNPGRENGSTLEIPTSGGSSSNFIGTRPRITPEDSTIPVTEHVPDLFDEEDIPNLFNEDMVSAPAIHAIMPIVCPHPMVSAMTTTPAASLWFGDPVFAHNGEFVCSEEDLMVPGRGLSFAIERIYRSQSKQNGYLGHGWDFQLESWIHVDGSDNVTLFNGCGRADVFSKTASGWDAPMGYYVEMEFLGPPTNEYVITGATGTKHHYDANSRVLKKIVDRNGNTIQIQTNSNEGFRVETVTDPRGEQVTFAYYDDPAADPAKRKRLKSITDWTGRILQYDYYVLGENGGQPGDLKSVTIFENSTAPAGPTVVYVYENPAAGTALDHNLTHIVKPKEVRALLDANTLDLSDGIDTTEETALKNAATIANSYDVSDRVKAQTYGDGSFDFQYDFPSAGQTTITDREGNRTIATFNGEVPVSVERQKPDGTTISTVNFTQGDLGNGFYENTEVELQRGNKLKSTFDRTNADSRFQGNLKQLEIQPGTAGAGPTITSSFTYDTNFRFVKTYTSPRGFEAGNSPADFTTTFTYDPANGNLTRIDFPDATIYDHTGAATGTVQDTFKTFEYNAFGQVTKTTDLAGLVRQHEYYTSADGTKEGYLKKVILDPGGLDIAVSFDYDVRGNLISVTDPRNFTTTATTNYLNRVTQVTAPAPFTTYQTNYTYNDNGFVETVETRNVKPDSLDPATRTPVTDSENTVVTANEFFTTDFTYDRLDKILSISREIDSSTSATTVFEYDANDNLIRITKPEGNKVKFEYDARDLLKKVIDGEGSTTTTPAETEYFYDAAGNRIAVDDPEDDRTTFAYDALNRLVEVEDPIGNRTVLTLDAAGNVTEAERFDDTGTRLELVKNAYDELERIYQSDIFENAVLGTKPVRTSVEYDPANGTVLVAMHGKPDGTTAAANRVRFTYGYDAIYRLTKKTDAVGNTVEYAYDPSSNLVQITETEKDSTGTASDEVFVYDMTYDALDRLTKRERKSGDGTVVTTDEWDYNSRNLAVFHQNARGNTESRFFDGLNRLRIHTRDMRQGGNGAGSLLSGEEIVTSFGYDLNSRLTSATDPNGNTTGYVYDDLDRRTKIQYADNTTTDGDAIEEELFEYYVDSTLETRTDQSGNVVTYTYDAANRLTKKEIARAAGTLGATKETFAYDGLYRLTEAKRFVPDATGTDVQDSRVVLDYDGLSRRKSDAQTIGLSGFDTTGTTVRVFDEASNRVQLNYPGGRIVSFPRDVRQRLVGIFDRAHDPVDPTKDPAIVSNYEYFGPHRRQSCVADNGIKTSWGYDKLRRNTLIKHENTNSSPATTVASFEYEFDPNDLRKVERRQPEDERDEYGYDSIDRLTNVRRKVPDAFGTLGTGQTTENVTYDLDKAGNRTTVTVEDETSGATDPKDYGPPTPMNEYPSVEGDTVTHDDRGNREAFRGDVYGFDYLNHLVHAATIEGLTVDYRYDALGRRTERTVRKTGTGLIGNVREVGPGKTHATINDALTAIESDLSSGTIAPTEIVRVYGDTGTPFAESILIDSELADGSFVLSIEAAPDNTPVVDSTKPLEIRNGAKVSVNGLTFQGASGQATVILCGQNIQFTNNQVNGTSGERCIEVQGSSGVTVASNEVRNGKSGLFARATQNLKVQSNFFIRPTSYHVQLRETVGADVFHNSCLGGKYGLVFAETQNSDCRNNIVSAATEIGIFVGDADRATITLDHNLGHKNGRYGYWFPDPQPSLDDFQAASGQAQSSLVQDPRFVDTTSGSEDLHLQLEDGSGTGTVNPVLQAGAMLATTWRRDIDGGQFLTSSRPIGADDPGAGVTRFFYEGVECIEEQDIYGGTSATYVYGTGLDEVLELKSSAGQFFLHAKSLGSIARATDSGGAVAEQYSYTEYGELTIRDAGGNLTGESGIRNVWAFTGRRFDGETNLQHFRARAYEPGTGRFLSRDPEGLYGDSLGAGNPYDYAGNDPVNLTDRFGEQGEDEDKQKEQPELPELVPPIKTKDGKYVMPHPSFPLRLGAKEIFSQPLKHPDNKLHTGVDYPGNPGEKVIAPASGILKRASVEVEYPSEPGVEPRINPNHLVLGIFDDAKQPQWIIGLAHVAFKKKFRPKTKGKKVEKGQEVGEIDVREWGRTNFPHVHISFFIWDKNKKRYRLIDVEKAIREQKKGLKRTVRGPIPWEKFEEKKKIHKE